MRALRTSLPVEACIRRAHCSQQPMKQEAKLAQASSSPRIYPWGAMTLLVDSFIIYLLAKARTQDSSWKMQPFAYSVRIACAGLVSLSLTKRSEN